MKSDDDMVLDRKQGLVDPALGPKGLKDHTY